MASYSAWVLRTQRRRKTDPLDDIFQKPPGITLPLLSSAGNLPAAHLFGIYGRGSNGSGPAETKEFDMRFASIMAVSAIVFSSSLALAQNAGTGSTTPSGDSAVSPATVNPAGVGSNDASRSSLGAGVNSGAMNNGTTGDTIGTGSGTSSDPSAGQATTNPVPDRR
jgi:hypothetical protein